MFSRVFSIRNVCHFMSLPLHLQPCDWTRLHNVDEKLINVINGR
jgi:hypothetical protein